jgi:hypothetical protein
VISTFPTVSVAAGIEEPYPSDAALVQVGLLAQDRLLVEAVARAGARAASVEADATTKGRSPSRDASSRQPLSVKASQPGS